MTLQNQNKKNISVKIDSDLNAKIEFLRQTTFLNTANIIRYAIAQFYEQEANKFEEIPL